ncbi:MAG TPA: hypothetical protein VFD48_03175, partial [Pyrinomonadaceae bacterium]|nr:hypothetical protein [Pyrinomonadaceae bacterium]
MVQPGEEFPESGDLLTEATLPIEKRGTQRRYTSPHVGTAATGSAGVFACIVRITDFADQSRTPALPTSVPVIGVVPVRFRVQCEHPE